MKNYVVKFLKRNGKTIVLRSLAGIGAFTLLAFLTDQPEVEPDGLEDDIFGEPTAEDFVESTAVEVTEEVN